MNKTEIFVYLNINKIDNLVGTLCIFESSQDYECTFEYSDEWLNNKFAYPISGELPLSKKIFRQNMLFNVFIKQCFMSRVSFGLRYLALYLKKRNLLSSYEELDVDALYKFINGNYEYRMQIDMNPFQVICSSNRIIYQNDIIRNGAFRFKLDKTKDFLCTYDKFKLPTEKEIPQILKIIYKINMNEETFEEFEYFNYCTLGLDGGKPKFSVIDNFGSLSIVKLSQYYNIEAIDVHLENFALYLANKFGITTQESSVHSTDNGEIYLLIKRFDRIGEERIPFITLGSFLSEARFFFNHKEHVEVTKNICCKNVEQNLKELFKRKLFRIAISNTNDFISNIGFLYNKNTEGWNLAPDYDIFVGYDNYRSEEYIKNYEKYEIDTAINEYNNLLKDYKLFNLSRNEVKIMLQSLKELINNWKETAIKLGFNNENIYRIKIYPQALDKINFE